MNQALKTVWTKALVSGQFKQNRYTLRREIRTNSDGSKEYAYCPLGVLCFLTGYKPESWYNTYPKTEGSIFDLTEEIKVSKWHEIAPKDQYEISFMNDNGNTFEQIASWINLNL